MTSISRYNINLTKEYGLGVSNSDGRFRLD